jgi:hypothetical protein
LYRTKLSHQLALDHIRGRETALSDYEELLACSVDNHALDLDCALTSVVTNTHFLLLKVYYEYYLNRLVYSVWDRYFLELTHQQKSRLLSEEYELREFARAVAHNAGREYVLGKVIPRHGLRRLRDALKHSTGIELEKVLNREKPWYWSQIHSAFEVRHLVEHTNGRADDAFITEVYPSPLWRNSSWGDLPLSIHAEIAIREVDFEKTFQAMIESVPILCKAVVEWQPVTS